MKKYIEELNLKGQHPPKDKIYTELSNTIIDWNNDEISRHVSGGHERI